MSSFLQEMLAPLASVAITIATPVAVGALVQFMKKLGVDIEAKNREALQSALENAATVAIARAGGPGAGAVISIATDYVRASVPDAIKKFGLDDKKLDKLLQPHIEKARTNANK